MFHFYYRLYKPIKVVKWGKWSHIFMLSQKKLSDGSLGDFLL